MSLSKKVEARIEATKARLKEKKTKEEPFVLPEAPPDDSPQEGADETILAEEPEGESTVSSAPREEPLPLDTEPQKEAPQEEAPPHVGKKKQKH